MENAGQYKQYLEATEAERKELGVETKEELVSLVSHFQFISLICSC